jgi:hypothetical protein
VDDPVSVAKLDVTKVRRKEFSRWSNNKKRFDIITPIRALFLSCSSLHGVNGKEDALLDPDADKRRLFSLRQKVELLIERVEGVKTQKEAV